MEEVEFEVPDGRYVVRVAGGSVIAWQPIPVRAYIVTAEQLPHLMADPAVLSLADVAATAKAAADRLGDSLEVKVHVGSGGA